METGLQNRSTQNGPGPFTVHIRAGHRHRRLKQTFNGSDLGATEDTEITEKRRESTIEGGSEEAANQMAYNK